MMDIIAMATVGTKYLIDAFKNSKALEDRKEKVLGAFFDWVQRVVFKKNRQLQTAVEQGAHEDAIRAELIPMLEDEAFRQEFSKQLQTLSASFEGNIDTIDGNAHIGENIEGQVDPANANNSFKGDIKNIKGDFHLGNNRK